MKGDILGLIACCLAIWCGGVWMAAPLSKVPGAWLAEPAIGLGLLVVCTAAVLCIYWTKKPK